MRSFTFSSERIASGKPWLSMLGGALAVVIAVAAGMEIRLAQLGYKGAPLDSPAKWAHQRERADLLGKRALILVGQSRMQLDLDLDVLRKETGLEPVLLAVNGSATGAILDDLAADPDITGTVIVDYYDGQLGMTGDTSRRYQQYYDTYWKGAWKPSPSTWIESVLTDTLHDHLRLYADGANPVISLTERIAKNKPASDFLTFLPDRSVLADYAKVSMPDYYYRRIASDLNVDPESLGRNTEAVLSAKLADSTPFTAPSFLDYWNMKLNEVKATISPLRARGGKVFFVAMPIDGMEKEIVAKLFPKENYWDAMVQTLQVPALRTIGNPAFSAFRCPDGSHLDYRSRAAFTALLVKELGLVAGRSAVD